MIKTNTASPYRYVIGGLTLWAHFATGLSFQSVSPVLPLITDDYGINHTTAGVLVGIVMIIHGAFGIPGGIIVGRVGVWRIYTVSWFMMGALTLMALSPGFEGLMALRIVYGLGVAAMLPATGPLIMQWFRPREVPIITSLNIACVSLGIVVSVSTAAPLADLIGWETVLGIFGAVGLAGAFAWLVWGKAREEAWEAAAPLSPKEIWSVLKNKTIFLLGLADTACFSMYVALTGWLPTFYNEARGMSLAEAGFLTSLLPFMGIFAVLLGGFLPLRIRPRRLFFIVPGVMAGVGGLGSFLIDNTAVTYFSVILMGLGAWLYVPSLLTLPIELPGMTPQKVALAWGWIMTASGVGTFIAPLVVGIMKDSTGSFTPGFLIFGLLAWFLFVAGFLLPGTGGRRAQPPSAVASPAPAPD
jgi:cyanate permease